MQLLSLVVPCFNEEATIQTFYDEVMKYEDRIDAELEFCFIDDGSTDRTIEILRDLHKKRFQGSLCFFFQKLRERSRALCRAFYG